MYEINTVGKFNLQWLLKYRIFARNDGSLGKEYEQYLALIMTGFIDGRDELKFILEAGIKHDGVMELLLDRKKMLGYYDVCSMEVYRKVAIDPSLLKSIQKVEAELDRKYRTKEKNARFRHDSGLNDFRDPVHPDWVNVYFPENGRKKFLVKPIEYDGMFIHARSLQEVPEKNIVPGQEIIFAKGFVPGVLDRVPVVSRNI